jgi:hypothetical protein
MQHEFDTSKLARQALGMVGYPTPKDCGNMLHSNMIQFSCPVTTSNIATSNKIFGPDIATLKGETVCNVHDPVLTGYIKISKDIMDLNINMSLAADMMFLSGLGFLVVAALKFIFTTIEHVPHRTKPILIKSLNKIFNLYNSWGFKDTTALMDR